MDFVQFRQNSAISSDLALTRPFKWSFSYFVFHLLTEDPGPSILSVVAILPDFNEFLPFRQDSTIYTDLAVIQPVQWSFKPFVSHLLGEDPGLSIPSAVAILPDFDGFLPILSKLNYLDRCNRHPATKVPKLTLCLPPARWGSSDSRCSGNIASFRWISFNFIKKNLTIYTVIRPPKCQN